jgi:hypothetical protein
MANLAPNTGQQGLTQNYDYPDSNSLMQTKLNNGLTTEKIN